MDNTRRSAPTHFDVPAIELIDIYTAFGEQRVLRGVSFGAPEGRITAILGPSGVGKTTCLRHVVGLLQPDSGDVLIDGQSSLNLRKSKRLALSKRFGVLLQGSGLYGSALWDSMTVSENLMYQLRALRGYDEHELRLRTLQCLREVGLRDSANMMPADLSAGMRRRVALARALIADPEFVVLDSFELGVDVVRLKGLCDLILRRHAEHGGTYLIATQNMEVARRIADEVVVLWGGRVMEQGPAKAVLESLQPEVRQLVTGSAEGPLGLAGEDRVDGAARSVPRPPIEEGLELPVPLTVLAVMAVITASVFGLGGGNAAEVVVLAAAWRAAAVLLVLHHRRAR
jgi:phospholipid/cholesterol/gamma-HCH transport system ATP-binding protein